MTEQQEEFKISGDDLIRKVKEIIKEGNARMIIIKNEDGKEIVQFPVTVGVVGTLLAAPLAALGAIAALVTNCTIVVVKR
ncbi:MAG: hypothetical protein A2898_01010 [Candidatus Kerfeldbacteria bacterium RIFCSPLOWO2_01_FULL_48_11]|uniref:DUF4342 domain-containing protein n=1 Tax=Candidatus Kerfeldbacteria bacterium RIFCSPLOWO2_01_FULL_48_11 TaxID=1798543 RepID=A0A1G2B678_9BACT|nr:MAG: hypothetical protein UY34_C0005G0002 [Parcubacteria group bacterium GW2011_GWA2_48_9]KKW16443.1 MAG: hypothetical protein UY52_C0004G0007 [Parcubacteria group bacterium GW2011_GWC2_49_9]OGY84671.1 MAG: hypothetical protein A2898_01010 [Candidatus Kerfeldbacteria bacterium RIFCSPLOWO2_01_FULL_48_11]HCM68473.1 hypothetical protein [Candidatus Kerfeldbacteria bacterium]